MNNWKQINDNDVRSIWRCIDDECQDNEETSINPDWYEENGTPLCSSCEQDMTYICTEINLTNE